MGKNKNQTEDRNLDRKLRDETKEELTRSPSICAHLTKSVMKIELIPSMISLFEATESKGLKGLK
jgi:hypothetical protein